MELIDIFGKFGLIGVVVGALFVQNFMLLKEIRQIVADSDARIKALSETHATERMQWLEAFRRNTDLLRDFTHKIDKV